MNGGDLTSKQDLLASLRDYGTVAGKRMTVQDRACHAAADEIDRLTRREAELVKALDDTESERLLRALAGALSKAFISTWQSTAYWAGELDEALEWIKKQDERAALKGDATP